MSLDVKKRSISRRSLTFSAFGLIVLIVISVWLSDLAIWLADKGYWLNNDHLAPFDYIRLLESGRIDWSAITHSRIPSLWPELPIAWIARSFRGEHVASFASYLFIKPVVTTLLLSWFCSILFRRQKNLSLLLVIACFLALCLGISWYKDILYLSVYPIRHGGNLDNFLVASILFFGGLSVRQKRFHFWFIVLFLALVSMTGAFSNRLFLVQFTAPVIVTALVVFIVSQRYKIKNNVIHGRGLALVLCVLASSLLGYFQYLLSVHQCGDVASSMVLPDFSGYARNWVVLAGQPFVFFIIFGLSFVFAGLYCLDSWLSKSVKHDYLLWQPLCLSFVGLVTSITSFLYIFLPESLLDQNLWRYLVVPAFVLPFGVACSLSMFLGNIWDRKASAIFAVQNYDAFWPKPAFLCLNLASILCLAYVIVSSMNSISSISSKYKDDYSLQSSWLNNAIDSNGLRGTLGFVADPPWESRRLYALSDGGILALSVSTDGNPLIFPHSRYEFVRAFAKANASRPSISDVVSPSWVLAGKEDFERMKAFYGEPLSKFGCFEGKGCLYKFDHSKVDLNTSIFLSTWQSDRYGCLSGSSERLRSRAIGALKKIPVIGKFVFGD